MFSKARKGMALSIATVLTLGVLAGCAGSGNKGGETPAPSGGGQQTGQKNPVEIQFWTISLSPTFDDYINGRIAKFESENEGIKVKWTDLPYDAIEQKLLTSIGSDEAPDVVNLNTGMALNMAQKGALVDLKAEAPETLSIYQESLLQGATFKGGVYAYPWYATSALLIMNTDIIKAAGLDPANAPTTWDEMTEWARTIKEKTGKYAFMPDRNMVQFNMAGVEWLNEDKTKATLNTPEAVAVYQRMRDWIEQDVIPHDSITKNYNEALNRYMAGELAFLLTGPQFLTRVRDNAPEIYAVTDVAPYILDKGKKLQASLMNVVVPKASKNHEAAIKFANFITNDESQLEFAKIVNILPSTKEAAKDPFFSQDTGNPLEDKARKITVDQMAISYDFTLGIGGKQSKVHEAYLKALERVMLGEITAQEGVDWLEEQVNNILAQPE